MSATTTSADADPVATDLLLGHVAHDHADHDDPIVEVMIGDAAWDALVAACGVEVPA